MGSLKSNSNRIRSRSFCLVLYPDDDKHKYLLDWLSTRRKVVYILHDKDKYLKSDVDGVKVTDDMVGSLKKAHYHVVIYYDNARSLKSVQKEFTDFYNFGTDRTSNFHVEAVSDLRSYIEYLTHCDLKSQYLGKTIYLRDSLMGDPELISSSLDSLDDKDVLNILINKVVSTRMPFWHLTQWVLSPDTDRVFYRCFISYQYLFRNICYDLGFDKKSNCNSDNN